jgi:pimeloyl-ACP methyl ester carboxylesterase
LKTIFFLLLSLFATSSFANGLPPYLADPNEIDPQFPPRMWAGEIDSGGHSINTIIYLANGAGPHPTAILLHGFPGNEKNLDLAQAIRRVGWNVVFFHYRGSWGSGGTYSFSNANEDVTRVLEEIRRPEAVEHLHIDPNKIALIGHSFGGFYAFYGAVNNPNISCVAGIAFSDLGHQAKRALSGDAPVWPWLRERQVLNGFTRTDAIADMNQNQDAYHVMEYGPRLKDVPTLIVTPDGDGELAVPRQIATADKFKEAGVNTSFYLVKDADHSFASKRTRLMEIVTDWLNGTCRK